MGVVITSISITLNERNPNKHLRFKVTLFMNREHVVLVLTIVDVSWLHAFGDALIYKKNLQAKK